MKKKGTLLALLICCLQACLSLLLALPAAAQPTKDRQMVILVVPGLRADDLARPQRPALENLRYLVSQSAVGWMNTRTARVPGQKRDPQEAAYLTLGAGARATAGPYARVITADTLARLKAENARLDHPVQVGALGETLRRAGLRVCVVGNEDDVERRRAARMIAMDAQGRVDEDATEAWSLRPDHTNEPFGVAYDMIDFPPVSPSCNLLVRVIGDVARADRYAPYCLPHIAAQHRANALMRLDAILGTYVRSWPRQPRVRFLLLSPSPADSASPGDRLAPILMFGEGVKPGLLTSGSTQRPGLLANTDLLPTVAAYFGLKPPSEMVGRPMEVIPAVREGRPSAVQAPLHRLFAASPSSPTPEQWARLHDRWAARAAQQAALGGLPTVQFVLVMLGIGCWTGSLTGRARHVPTTALRGIRRWDLGFTPNTQRLLCSTALVLLTLPLAHLLLPLSIPPGGRGAGPESIWQAALLLGVVLLAAAAFGTWRPAWAEKTGFGLMTALVLAVAVDLLTGGHLLQNAWMSYSVMEGARYYGIGNEYAGAVFAAALLAARRLLSQRPAGEEEIQYSTTPSLHHSTLLLVWSGLCLLALLMGLPMFGANAGGCLGAIVGFGVAGWVWWRGRLRLRDMLLVLVIAGALAGALFAVDLLRSGAAQSHIGRALGSDGGIVNILTRKAALNAYLLRHSPWSLGLLASAAGVFLLWRAPDSALRRRLHTDRVFAGGMAGLLAGALALLLFNDSGVVAASEAMLMTWGAISVRR